MNNPERGVLINERAFLGSQIVFLKDQIPRVEKQSRRTPPKSLKKEWDLVQEAQKQLPILKEKLTQSETQYQELTVTLTAIGAFGAINNPQS
jgi:hypothetical protein